MLFRKRDICLSICLSVCSLLSLAFPQGEASREDNGERVRVFSLRLASLHGNARPRRLVCPSFYHFLSLSLLSWKVIDNFCKLVKLQVWIKVLPLLVCLFVCLFVTEPVCLLVCLSISVSLSSCLFVCLFCLFAFYGFIAIGTCGSALTTRLHEERDSPSILHIFYLSLFYS